MGFRAVAAKRKQPNFEPSRIEPRDLRKKNLTNPPYLQVVHDVQDADRFMAGRCGKRRA